MNVLRRYPISTGLNSSMACFIHPSGWSRSSMTSVIFVMWRCQDQKTYFFSQETMEGYMYMYIFVYIYINKSLHHIEPTVWWLYEATVLSLSENTTHDHPWCKANSWPSKNDLSQKECSVRPTRTKLYIFLRQPANYKPTPKFKRELLCRPAPKQRPHPQPSLFCTYSEDWSVHALLMNKFSIPSWLYLFCNVSFWKETHLNKCHVFLYNACLRGGSSKVPMGEAVPAEGAAGARSRKDDIMARVREMQSKKHTLDVILEVLKDRQIKKYAKMNLGCDNSEKKTSSSFIAWFPFFLPS